MDKCRIQNLDAYHSIEMDPEATSEVIGAKLEQNALAKKSENWKSKMIQHQDTIPCHLRRTLLDDLV